MKEVLYMVKVWQKIRFLFFKNRNQQPFLIAKELYRLNLKRIKNKCFLLKAERFLNLQKRKWITNKRPLWVSKLHQTIILNNFFYNLFNFFGFINRHKMSTVLNKIIYFAIVKG